MSVNRNKEILLSLGLTSEASIQTYSSHVRDREDVGVLIDTASGIVFLDRSDHLEISYYEAMEEGAYWGGVDRETALKKYALDDYRRFEQFKDYFADKDLLDVGCGTGGFLDYAKPVCKKVAGVEPQEGVRKGLESLGYEMYRVPEDIPQNSFDVITLFHTLEHLIEPLEVLENLKQALRPGGVLIVEVPHARDALFALDTFKKFSLWGEHMILHTQESLRKFLSVTGFNEIEVFGHQRYSMANHLGWLACGLPGGQKLFAANGGGESEMEVQYKDLLISNDKTDTIMAIARV